MIPKRTLEVDPETRRARLEWAEQVVRSVVDAPLAIGTTLARLQLLYLTKPRLTKPRTH
jgi:hypothetical protein